MQTWFRNSRGRKKNGRPTGAAVAAGGRGRGMYQPRLERLERRTLLSVSPTGMTIPPAEGTLFNGAVATFTATDAGPFTATIGWGDGTTTAGSISGTTGSFTVLGSHTYADEGTDAISVVIADAADSTTATATSTAAVTEADRLAPTVPATVSATEGITFTGTVATFTDMGYPDNLPGDFTATINWGDGTVTSGIVSGGAGTLAVTGSHLYADEGSNPVTVTLADDSPGTATATATGTATVVEADSLTAGTATVSATEGTTFTGAVATLANTYIGNTAADFTATIAWGDGTTTDGAVSGGSGAPLTVSGSHAYAEDGAYTITTSIADDGTGTATGTATTTANVAETDLTVTPSIATLVATEGTAVSGAVATISDPGSTDPAAEFVALIEWGDGTTNTGTVAGSDGSYTVSGSHTYADEGTFSVQVTTTETGAVPAATATATFTADVAEDDTLVAGTAATVSPTEGATFTGALATFTNTTYAGNPATDFTATIVWGDGTTTSAAVSGGSGAPLTVSGSHAYAEDGAYTITTTIADDGTGTATGTATTTANVAETDLTVTPSIATLVATEGTAVSGAVATISDPGSADPTADIVATIDWGDGTTDTGTVAGSDGSYTVSGGHTYADEGTFSVKVTATETSAVPAATATATFTADVAEGDTLASAGAATVSTTEGTTFTGTVATFTNATYPGNPASDFTATIHWGDGSATTGSVSGTAGTLTVSGSHLYADEGSNPLTVALTDDAPGTATATATGTATVAEGDTLVAVPATASATEGTTFTGAVAMFTNTTYAANPASDFTATIHWGDGSTSAGTISGTAGTLTVSGRHLYTDEGSNPLTVALTDDAPGTATATATGTANVVEGDTLVATGPATVSATEGTTFTGAIATFTNATYAGNPASDFTAIIAWGDGTTTDGTVSGSVGTLTVSGSHLYTDEVSSPITVTLADDAPGTSKATATGTATVVEGDTLVAIGAATVSATEGATFTAAVATFTNAGNPTNPPSDFTATIVWGDGATSTGSVSGAAGTLTVSGSHLYADEAAHPLTVTLADNAPGTATASATGTAIVAEADTLTPAAAATVSATEGTTFAGTVARFTNTGNPTNPPSDFTATIVWGDGTTSAGTATGGAGTLTVSGSHLYADEGSNPLTVTLTDDAPGTATATATGTATVAEADTLTPAAAATVSATEGTTFAGTLATFTNAGNSSNPPNDFTATIDWGDGTTTTGTVSGSAGTLTVMGSHLYAEEGTKSATVVLANDAPGTAKATATTTVNVADATLTATGTTLTATAGTSFTAVVASFTDANPGAPVSDFTATIDWGDGVTSAGSVAANGSGFNVTGTHTYAAAGTDAITVHIADLGGSTATATSTANVAAAVMPAALAISKTAAATGNVGQELTYTIIVSNTGGSAATRTIATDMLPAGLTFVSATDATLGIPLTSMGGIITDDIGTLAGGGSDIIRIVVTPTASLAGQSVTNTAGVVSPDANGGVPVTTSATTSIAAGTPTGHICFLAGVPGDGTAQTFITNLYRELLGREPDPPSLPFWMNYLQEHNNSAGRVQVIEGFMDSPEYKSHYITCVYESLLGRAPDAGGLQFWTQKMGDPGTPGDNTGSADEKYIVAAFLGSDEFYIKSGNTPQSWINAVYEDVFGRAADGGGMTFWTNELRVRGSADRDGIMRDLLAQPEAAHFLLDSFYSAAGGTSSNPLAVPGTEAGMDSTPLAMLTGAGWENLYLEGRFNDTQEGNDSFFASLVGDGNWDDLQLLMLATDQYYSNSNRPVTAGTTTTV